ADAGGGAGDLRRGAGARPAAPGAAGPGAVHQLRRAGRGRGRADHRHRLHPGGGLVDQGQGGGRMRLGPIHWDEIVGRPTWRWGDVATAAPALTVLLDGDEEAMPVEPSNVLVAGLQVADRVYCQLAGRGTAKHIVI